MTGRSEIMKELGIAPIINAHGHPTTIGGNNPSETVRAAMDDAARDYVKMSELVEVTGDRIAEMLDVPAAMVTPGAAAALALGAAACITRNHPDRMEQIPDTTGMPNEFIIQRQLRVIYDKALTIPGGVLVEVGEEDGTTEERTSRRPLRSARPVFTTSPVGCTTTRKSGRHARTLCRSVGSLNWLIATTCR